MQPSQMKKSFPPKLLAGMSLSLLAPTIYTLWLGPSFLKPNVTDLVYNLISFGVFWFLAFAVLGFTLLIEKQSLRTIGWQQLSRKWTLGALVIGVLLSLLVPVFTWLVSRIISAPQTGSIVEVTTSHPWWVILIGVFTAGVTEEILFRGYPIERWLAGNENNWLGAGISLTFFIALHATGWNLVHLIGVVIPLGLVLTGTYLWRRNLLFVMIIHFVIDLPLVFLALPQ